MKRQVGRPLKYKPYIMALDDNELYSPAKIVINGIEKNLMPDNLTKEERNDLRRKIRHTLSRFRKSHQFPGEGDGFVELPGQSPTPAWFGWRWKDAVPK